MHQHQFEGIVEATLSAINELLVVKGGEYAGSEDRLDASDNVTVSSSSVVSRMVNVTPGITSVMTLSALETSRPLSLKIAFEP